MAAMVMKMHCNKN